jgi:hypothetical protein
MIENEDNQMNSLPNLKASKTIRKKPVRKNRNKLPNYLNDYEVKKTKKMKTKV